jgi:hypothetical protein
MRKCRGVYVGCDIGEGGGSDHCPMGQEDTHYHEHHMDIFLFFFSPKLGDGFV